MKCQSSLAVLSPYLDGDLPPEQRETLELHLAECRICRRQTESMRALKHAVARLPSKDEPPVAVRARIEGLRFGTPRKMARWSGIFANLRRRRTLRHAFVFATVLATAVGVLLVHGQPDREPHQRAHSTAEFLVDDHLKYARRDARTQLATSSPAELQSWFEHQVELAAKLPELRGARLIGGRRCKVQGRPAALAFYEKTGTDGRASEPLSLFVFEPGGEDWSEMEEVPGLHGKRLCRHHQRGVGLLIWEERGLVYAVAGALEADELRTLVAGEVE